MPYRNFVNTLSLPSTVGTAIAASAAFTILAADSILGQNSPESLDQRREMVIILTWSAGLYAIATAITVCLQALYGSPSFCEIITKKLNYRPERRTRFEPWPSCDFLRYIVAYIAVGGAYVALILHLAATILIIGIFKPYAPTLVAQLLIMGVFILGILGWVISIAIEQPRAGERWRKLLCLPASSRSHEISTGQSLQVESKGLSDIESSGAKQPSA